jgi:hypothetical protein
VLKAECENALEELYAEAPQAEPIASDADDRSWLSAAHRGHRGDSPNAIQKRKRTCTSAVLEVIIW